MNVFVVDLDRCSGCRNCQIACKDEHCGTDWLPYAKAEPLTGQYWMKVEEKERGSVPLVWVSYLPRFCQHCQDAPCIAAGDGAVYRRDDGLVIIDPEKSQDMDKLVDVCPYGTIYWNEELRIPQKCTGCAHLLDDGWDVPRCVDVCATGALRYGPYEDFADEIAKAGYLEPNHGDADKLAPIVYYLNIPKRFVGGKLVDFGADEVVIGARVRLMDGDNCVAEMLTDEFGDFFFNQVEPLKYTVVAVANDHEGIAKHADAREFDVNLGDIAMEPR